MGHFSTGVNFRSDSGYYDYEGDYYGDYYDYRSEYDYGRTRRGGHGYGRRDYEYGGYEGRGRRRSYFPRYRHDCYGDSEGPLHRSFRTPRTQTADRTLPSKHDNNVQMSLSYICNTKMQSKDDGQGGYAQPGARKAEGGEDYDGAGEVYNFCRSLRPFSNHDSQLYNTADNNAASNTFLFTQNGKLKFLAMKLKNCSTCLYLSLQWRFMLLLVFPSWVNTAPRYTYDSQFSTRKSPTIKGARDSELPLTHMNFVFCWLIPIQNGRAVLPPP